MVQSDHLRSTFRHPHLPQESVQLHNSTEADDCEQGKVDQVVSNREGSLQQIKLQSLHVWIFDEVGRICSINIYIHIYIFDGFFFIFFLICLFCLRSCAYLVRFSRLHEAMFGIHGLVHGARHGVATQHGQKESA